MPDDVNSEGDSTQTEVTAAPVAPPRALSAIQADVLAAKTAKDHGAAVIAEATEKGNSIIDEATAKLASLKSEWDAAMAMVEDIFSA